MNALLLSAGLGTRLMPLTKTVPKCLIPIGGKPLLCYWIEILDKLGIEKIYINTFYLQKTVEEFIKKNPFKYKITLLHEDKLLGTGGTLKKYSNLFIDNKLLIIHADNLCVTDFHNFIESHKMYYANYPITMMTFFTDNPNYCGVVKVNSDKVVTDFFEKNNNPPSNLANGAVFIVEPEIINYLKNFPEDMFDFSRDVIPKFLNRIKIWHNNFYHRDIGNLASLKRANKDLHYIQKLIDYFYIKSSC